MANRPLSLVGVAGGENNPMTLKQRESAWTRWDATNDYDIAVTYTTMSECNIIAAVYHNNASVGYQIINSIKINNAEVTTYPLDMSTKDRIYFGRVPAGTVIKAATFGTDNATGGCTHYVEIWTDE